MHLLESYVLFSKHLWRVEWGLGLFHCYSWASGVETCSLSGKGLQSSFSLVSDGRLVFNLRQRSPVPFLKYVSLHWLSFWCDAGWVSFLLEIHRLCAVLALCGIHQSHPKKHPLFFRNRSVGKPRNVHLWGKSQSVLHTWSVAVNCLICFSVLIMQVPEVDDCLWSLLCANAFLFQWIQ